MKKVLFLLLTFLCCSLSSWSQELHTYSGDFPYEKRYGYMLDSTAKYTYYTNEDDERIYHGNYEMKFTGEGSSKKFTYWGKVKGRYENNVPVGEWTILYPKYDYKKKRVLFGHFKCNLVNGRPDGKVELIFNTSPTNASTATAIFTASAEYKNGVLDGPLTLSNKDKEYIIMPVEIKGQFSKGVKVGRWDIVLSNKDKCVIVFDENGKWEKGYCIDYESGEKSDYDGFRDEYLDSFGYISWRELISFIRSIRRK